MNDFHNAFDGFCVARFEFLIELVDVMRLPEYKGSALRGGFGCALKKVICREKYKDCASCPKNDNCIYIYIFETSPPKNSRFLKKNRRIPNPFIIEPPLEKKESFEKGEELSFGLVLIGRAIDYLPYFVYTFEELGRMGLGKGRGKYLLRKVSQYNDDGEKVIFNEGRFPAPCTVSRVDELLVSQGDAVTDRITLDFITPIRIEVNGKECRTLEFHLIIRNLLRRLSSFNYFHNGRELELDFRELIERSKKVSILDDETKWRDWERYSARQDQRIKMGGLTGRITFSGELHNFLPLLQLGEVVHVGKGATFGMGKYGIS